MDNIPEIAKHNACDMFYGQLAPLNGEPFENGDMF